MNEIVAQSELSPQLPKKVNLRRTTVLIVDPNEFARTFIRSICRNLHFGNILASSNTTEAFDLLRANKVHLVVCDWELQPQSSIDFVKKIRVCDQLPNNTVPVIILTSTGSPEAIVAARDAGVDDYLTRPIVMRRLLNSFVSVLCMPRTYVKSTTFIGPCRRRKKMPFNGLDRRVAAAANKNVAMVSAISTKVEEKAAVPVSTPADEKVAAMASAAPLVEEKSEELNDASMEEMEKAGEAAIAQEADTYSKVRLDDIAEIFNLVRAIKQPEAPVKDILEGIYKKALDVKGMGNTFGFPLLTKVGDLLCGFVRGPDPDSFKVLAKLQVVETHAIIMKMIVDSNMHDEKDELAKELIGELEGMVAKFSKT